MRALASPLALACSCPARYIVRLCVRVRARLLRASMCRAADAGVARMCAIACSLAVVGVGRELEELKRSIFTRCHSHSARIINTGACACGFADVSFLVSLGAADAKSSPVF